MGIRDTRMLQQALEKRWPIKPEFREAIVKRTIQRLLDPNISTRELASLTKCVIAMESQNILEEQHADRLDEGRNRILDMLRALEAADAISVDADGTTTFIEGSVIEPQAD